MGRISETTSLKKTFERYCEGCTIDSSCPQMCKGKFQALLRLNEQAKYARQKVLVRMPTGRNIMLPDWNAPRLTQ